MVSITNKKNKSIDIRGFKNLGMHFTVLFILLFITACEDYVEDDYQEYVVLEAYAVANQPLPEVRLSLALPLGEEYHFSDAALNEANVQIVLLDENGSEQDIFGYIHSSEEGIYVPEDLSHRVLPRRTYRVDINFNNRSEVLQAKTIIPDDFEIISEIPERIVYQSSKQLELVLSAKEKTLDQNVYVFNTIAQDPVRENLAPFWKALIEDEDDVDIEEFYNHSSQLVNEGNFDQNPDGTIRFNYPWTSIAFFGENLIVVNSIDKNLSDLISSQEVQLGGGNISPGEIPNLRYNVEGGIGIFGGIVSDTIRTYVERPEGI